MSREHGFYAPKPARLGAWAASKKSPSSPVIAEIVVIGTASLLFVLTAQVGFALHDL